MGTVALVAGGVGLSFDTLPPSISVSKTDTDLFWREASGPNGERALPALPLYQAVFAHDYQAAAKLLDTGVSPNVLLYSKRWSPLMVAIAYQDKEMVDLLLRYGADINYVSNDPADYTPLGVALSTALREALRGGGEDPTLDFSMFHHLLDCGADVNLEFGDDQDIAILSATLGQMNVVNELLSRGYHRDLSKLKQWLVGIRVSEDRQDDKDRAIAKIDDMLRKQ
jgi:hypothetical protein